MYGKSSSIASRMNLPAQCQPCTCTNNAKHCIATGAALQCIFVVRNARRPRLSFGVLREDYTQVVQLLADVVA